MLSKTPVALRAAFPSIDRERITNRTRVGWGGSHTRPPHPASIILLRGQPPSRLDWKELKNRCWSSTRSLNLAFNAASQNSYPFLPLPMASFKFECSLASLKQCRFARSTLDITGHRFGDRQEVWKLQLYANNNWLADQSTV